MATRAQKLRLGVFLLIAGTLFGGTVIALVGSSLLEVRDAYIVRIEGSIGGLEKGAQVRYNGIRVGRVESLRIAPEHPDGVELTLSLEHETPITVDTVAVLNMQGITGLKYIELSGGTVGSKIIEPGSEIPSGGSDIDHLTEQALAIATKIEKLLDNLVAATGGNNVDKVTLVLEEAAATLHSTRTFVDTTNSNVEGMVAKVNKRLDELGVVMEDARGLLASAQVATDNMSRWFKPKQLAAILTSIEHILDEVEARVGKQELGATIANTNALTVEATKLVRDTDVTLLRMRDDLRRALDDVATSTENIAELTQILVDNPSALISGRSERERALP